MDPIEQLPSDFLLDRCAQSWGLRNIAFVRKHAIIDFRRFDTAGSQA